MIGADLNATAEREEVIDFTIPYSYSGTTWFVKAGSPYTTVEDLNNPDVTIAFIAGSDTETATKKTFPNAKYRAMPTASMADLIAEVETDRSDAAANSNYVGGALVEKYSQVAIPSLTEEPDGIEPVGIGWAVPKGDSELLAQLNAFLKEMEESGEMATLKGKYLSPQAYAESVGLT